MHIEDNYIKWSTQPCRFGKVNIYYLGIESGADVALKKASAFLCCEKVKTSTTAGLVLEWSYYA